MTKRKKESIRRLSDPEVLAELNEKGFVSLGPDAAACYIKMDRRPIVDGPTKLLPLYDD